MRRIAVKLCLMLATAVSVVCVATTATTAGMVNGDTDLPEIAAPGAGVIITSSSTLPSLAARETAGPDTFALYGGTDHPDRGQVPDPDLYLGWYGQPGFVGRQRRVPDQG